MERPVTTCRAKDRKQRACPLPPRVLLGLGYILTSAAVGEWRGKNWDLDTMPCVIATLVVSKYTNICCPKHARSFLYLWDMTIATSIVITVKHQIPTKHQHRPQGPGLPNTVTRPSCRNHINPSFEYPIWIEPASQASTSNELSPCLATTFVRPVQIRNPIIPPIMPSDSKIQFTSQLEIQNEYLHEKVTDRSTGEVKVTDVHEPHSSTRKTTITSNNAKYEAKGVESPHVTEGEAVELNPATVGCDTSQL